MEFVFRQARASDIDSVAELFDALHDHLAGGTNYPGWIKGVYPARQDAEAGVASGELHVATLPEDGRAVGAVLLCHRPEAEYAGAPWAFDTDYSDVLVIRTLAVHPGWMRHKVGRLMMDYAAGFARENGMRAIRLDAYEGNLPALRLYEQCGYRHIGKVDLGLAWRGLPAFNLYELLLE